MKTLMMIMVLFGMCFAGSTAFAKRCKTRDAKRVFRQMCTAKKRIPGTRKYRRVNFCKNVVTTRVDNKNYEFNYTKFGGAACYMKLRLYKNCRWGRRVRMNGNHVNCWQ